MFNDGDNEEDKVTICVENKKFLCNRNKLSQHSPYFFAMFNGNFVETNERSVHIQEITTIGLFNILKTINGESDCIKYKDLLDTLQGACMLQFDNIKAYCIERLTNDLRTLYCLQIWFTADRLDLHPLCEKAKCKALMEFNTLKDSNCLLRLNIKELHSYLANTFLFCDSELDVFEAAVKWWDEYSKKSHENKDWNDLETKYLLTILSCIDYKSVTKMDVNSMLACTKISTNSTVKTLLTTICSLIDEQVTPIPTQIENEIKQLYFNCKKRQKTLLPCVVSSEFAWEPDRSKRLKSFIARDVNVSYYDYKTKTMEKLFQPNLQFDFRCTASLIGCKVLPYKENLLLFGGEYHYGTCNWNKQVWRYYTFKDQWELLTIMPKERRHFKACIIDDKMFIIGGTCKYRIVAHNEVLYYDIRKGKWVIDIKLPYPLREISICEYKKQLFVIPENLQGLYGYIFNADDNNWTKINIVDPLNLVPKFPDKFLLFSTDNLICIKGTYYIEMELSGSDLKVKSCEETERLHGDKIGHYIHNNQLYVFTKHDNPTYNKIYSLHCCDLVTKKTELLVQINDSIDALWHISTGCFPFFHYSVTKESMCVSDFMLEL